MAEWIDVNDRLPDGNRYCWVTLRWTKGVVITWYNSYESKWNQFGSTIIAWMYVEGKPEPYKPVKEKSSRPVDSNKHNCCDCDHYRGKVDGVMYCKFYGKFYGSKLGSCDAWEEIEDR